jgi:hypothetical protein
MDLSRWLPALLMALALLAAGCITEDAEPDGAPIDPFAPVHEDRVVELFVLHDTLAGTSTSMQSLLGLSDLGPPTHVASFRMEENRTDLDFHLALLSGLAQVRVDVVGPEGLAYRSGEATSYRLEGPINGHVVGLAGFQAESFPAGEYQVEFRVAGEMELRFTVSYTERVRIDGAGVGAILQVGDPKEERVRPAVRE